MRGCIASTLEILLCRIVGKSDGRVFCIVHKYVNQLFSLTSISGLCWSACRIVVVARSSIELPNLKLLLLTTNEFCAQGNDKWMLGDAKKL